MAAQVPVQVSGAPVNDGQQQQQFVPVPTSLYVGDLEWNVTDSQLYDLFNQLGQVVSVRVCRDLTSRRSLGYGYVNYANSQDAARAIEVLNFTPLNGKAIRIMYSHRDPSVRKSGSGNLFIKNLDKAIDQKALHDTFSAFGNILSCKIVTDQTGQSKGYGFVQYDSEEGAQKAIEKLNGMLLNNKQVYVGPFLSKQERDQAVDKKFTNVCVQNLSESTTDEEFNKIFSKYGPVTSAAVKRDADGNSKGFGFVNFENAEDAAKAVEALNGQKIENKEWDVGKVHNKLQIKVVSQTDQSEGYGLLQYDSEEVAQNVIEKNNGMLLKDKQVYVWPILSKQERDQAVDKTKFTNVYVKNLSESTTDEEFNKIFSEFGPVTSAVVMRDADGNSKGFGFVNFENAEDAAKAVEALNGQKIDNKEWYVGKAQKKREREQELKQRFEQSMKEAVDKSQGLNLYIKNLDDTVDDEGLKELFSSYGTITSCKVMRDPNGASKGSGFVAFSTSEEASRAIFEMNGKMVGSKPLYVALAQRKEERTARLQAQFSQMRPIAMAPAVAPRMPMYPPGGPGMGQQIFYGQQPTFIPPQPGFGYQQQLVPGMRPGGAPMPNFFLPMVQQGQQGQRPGGRRATGPGQQNQPPVPLMQQQMMPRGRMYRYPPGRNAPDGSMTGIGSGGMVPVPYDMGGVMPLRDAAISQPIPIGALASALANASPTEQRTMLGENLYPLVEQLEPEAAAKVTGMLLEMDQTEVLHLLESPEALKAKVAEAMDVLRNVSQQQQASGVANQMGGLSLNDGIVS